MWKQVRFNDDQIFGILSCFEDTNPTTLVVTLPGLGQAMSEKNYIFSNLRKCLGEYNVMHIQFDYYGHGDSYGELGDASITTMTSDAKEVINSLLKEYESVEELILIGNALGAVIALNLTSFYENRFKVKPILISPPVNIPPANRIFSSETLEALKHEGKLDSQQLIPGYDYYTLSDFDKKQYDFITKLGSHLLYLHGQFISYNMIQEIDEVNILSQIINVKSEIEIIVGEKDKETLLILNNIRQISTFSLDNVKYYHQHPAAMDQLIGHLIQMIKRTIKNK
ncbi:serine aminopeptidase domain-containing protein [Cytobacillus solani]|uniref:serine aminopeptidase domain-containing protein n=1 Tax=Cytobacillus solani TaxID=1637975 RepID=UPI00114E1946|nr:alpha/beta hydrolase [Cytobacillus solani]